MVHTQQRFALRSGNRGSYQQIESRLHHIQANSLLENQNLVSRLRRTKSLKLSSAKQNTAHGF